MHHVHFIEFITNHNHNKQTKKSLIPISYEELKTKHLNLIALCREKNLNILSFRFFVVTFFSR